MRLYIDEANLISLIESEKVDVNVYNDCVRMVRRQLDVHYNFPKKHYPDGSLLATWFNNDTNGFGYSEGCTTFANNEECIYPSRPLKSTFCNQANAEQLSAVYLLNDNVTAIRENHTVLIGCVGEEISVLKKLFCGRDYEFNSLYNIQDPNSFKDWCQLDEDGHVLPCTEILINDRYLYGKDQKEVIEANLNVILRQFGMKKGAKTNLIIITKDDGCNAEEWENRKNNLKKELLQQKYSSVNVTFLVSSESGHDRMILTNYRLFISGDSFKYYTTSGRICTHGVFLEIKSMAKRDTFDYAFSQIQRAQTIIDNLKDKCKERIIGDKISNWLRF